MAMLGTFHFIFCSLLSHFSRSRRWSNKTASLQDTLRAALGSRTDALFGTEDEYDDDDDDYWDE